MCKQISLVGVVNQICVCVSGISYIMGTKCQFSAYGSIFGPHEENSLQIIQNEVFLKI